MFSSSMQAISHEDPETSSHAEATLEGWAHYAEQMMVEEGFGGGDLKLKLAQLSEALLRDCRFIVGIKLHTQNMTVEQGARLFVEKGFQERANAYEEARRGAYNPTYLYYTLGKLQVYKLREDYKLARGRVYSLGEFHSEFIRQGGLPVKMIREILLPGDQGPTLCIIFSRYLAKISHSRFTRSPGPVADYAGGGIGVRDDRNGHHAIFNGCHRQADAVDCDRAFENNVRSSSSGIRIRSHQFPLPTDQTTETRPYHRRVPERRARSVFRSGSSGRSRLTVHPAETPKFVRRNVSGARSAANEST